MARDVFIQAEFLLRIVHNVIAAPGVKLIADAQGPFFIRVASISAATSSVTTRTSSPSLLRYRRQREARCRREPADAAGIAGRRAAREYLGKILQTEIERQAQLHPLSFDPQGGGRRPPARGKKQRNLRTPLPALDPGRSEQDLDRVQAEEPARGSVQIAQRVRAAGHQLRTRSFSPHARSAFAIHLMWTSCAATTNPRGIPCAISAKSGGFRKGAGNLSGGVKQCVFCSVHRLVQVGLAIWRRDPGGR